MKKIIVILTLSLLLSACGKSSEEDSGSTDFGTDYQSCVTELFEARLAGVLGATDAEIYEECRSEYP